MMIVGGITTDYLAGGLVAFALAVVAVGVDIQQTIQSRLGNGANTSVLAVWQGWIILAMWGFCDAGLYIAILANPDWAKATFPFVVSGNKLWAGVIIGVSAVIIIRSKLAKVADVEIGFEWAYLWARAFVLTSVNKERARKRVASEKRYYPMADDVAKFPGLFTDLKKWIELMAKGLDEQRQTAVLTQLAEISRTSTANSSSPDKDVDARRNLMGLAFDYFTTSEIDESGALS